MRLHLNKLESPIPEGGRVLSLIEVGLVVLEKEILKDATKVLLFLDYLHFKKVVSFISLNFNPLYLSMHCGKFS